MVLLIVKWFFNRIKLEQNDQKNINFHLKVELFFGKNAYFGKLVLTNFLKCSIILKVLRKNRYNLIKEDKYV